MATPTTLPASFTAGQVLTAAQMNDLRGAFRILQVVSTTKSDTFSASVATGANTAITGLSVSITPSSANSKILVFCNANGSVELDTGVLITLFRGATAIGVGASPGSRQAITSALGSPASTDFILSTTAVLLDSPATTSATTYSANISHQSGITRTVYVNRSSSDTNASANARAISTITVMEISA
jgi:hypothetical protein